MNYNLWSAFPSDLPDINRHTQIFAPRANTVAGRGALQTGLQKMCA